MAGITIVAGIVIVVVLRAAREGREVSFWPPRIGPKPREQYEDRGARGSGADALAHLPTDTIAILHAKHGPNAGEVFAITSGLRRVDVGKGASSDFRLDHPTMSQAHFVVGVLPEQAFGRRNYLFTLMDAMSANGTFVNGEKVTKRQLAHGDVIQAGAVELVFSKLG